MSINPKLMAIWERDGKRFQTMRASGKTVEEISAGEHTTLAYIRNCLEIAESAPEPVLMEPELALESEQEPVTALPEPEPAIIKPEKVKQQRVTMPKVHYRQDRITFFQERQKREAALAKAHLAREIEKAKAEAVNAPIYRPSDTF